MFNEKKEEYSAKQRKNIPVWISPKYEQSKAVALKIIEKYKNINEGDFWILMNETKSGKMAYTGLIISHNACLKLNDTLPVKERFSPSCVSINQNGYNGALVFTYCNEDQGIFEVGEVSQANCKNAYPYAMAFKRCFDRVVLKQTKLAYDGVYSDSEADEFREPINDPEDKKNTDTANKDTELVSDFQADEIVDICDKHHKRVSDMCKYFGVKEVAEMTVAQYKELKKIFKEK